MKRGMRYLINFFLVVSSSTKWLKGGGARLMKGNKHEMMVHGFMNHGQWWVRMWDMWGMVYGSKNDTMKKW